MADKEKEKLEAMFYRKKKNNKKKKKKKDRGIREVVCPYLPEEIVVKILFMLPHECVSSSRGCGVSRQWREIKYMIKLHPDISFDYHDVVYMKSVCYWLYKGVNKFRILSFDMSDEKFGIIQLPFDTKSSDTARKRN
ncbi:hypothetical protein G4B88_010526 [Cannabis sativa]|uniref:F-box associated beta-propeller type 1 domain-containing protein n=1 Tax=Cannabis sativa TaxID=3483 RepID=A0A7J6G8L3_CANSA|nr:hypothetical protein G4B88_010526 [Cannabis sativa]